MTRKLFESKVESLKMGTYPHTVKRNSLQRGTDSLLFHSLNLKQKKK